ncbi:MAG: 3-deoxy-manno-octulosonate cytidylyltransferase [Xanthomonadales bacterium]|nr:3-deoxy-manno-octulosonate cytidylyltransferase [Xanthomonadales bacterium]
MSVSYHIVIPARMASQRLPGKPLLEIGGKTLIEHVYLRACSADAQSVVIATDDAGIARAARGFGATAVMTSSEHTSGSDRIAECVDLLGWGDDTLVVNLQGDEPLMPPVCLDQAAALLAGDDRAEVASLYWPVASAEEVTDPNVVKVVTAGDGAALYFSRSVIPHPRGAANIAAALQAGLRWKRHIGLYAYRASALRAFTATPPAPLERVEKLEQLRFLESGRRIVMARAAEFIPAGVDTADDLERVRAMLGQLS